MSRSAAPQCEDFLRSVDDVGVSTVSLDWTLGAGASVRWRLEQLRSSVRLVDGHSSLRGTFQLLELY